MIWMLDKHQNNKKCQNLPERWKVSATYSNDKLSSYEKLLQKDSSVSVHHRNIQSLAIEILQVQHDQSCEIVTIFTQVKQG